MGRIDDIAIAGAFEELPVILVVLVAVSLFSVSVAHAALSLDDGNDRDELQRNCLAFAELVRNSGTLADDAGTYDYQLLANFSQEDFLSEFNSTLLGFEYRVQIQCIDIATGNITLAQEIMTSPIPKNTSVASYHTCVNVDYGGTIGAARLIISIWEALP